jgi:hypothetical protein
MSMFKLLVALAVLSAAIVTPVTAQQVISEPGYCAFFYPNANCQNKGPDIDAGHLHDERDVAMASLRQGTTTTCLTSCTLKGAR